VASLKDQARARSGRSTSSLGSQAKQRSQSAKTEDAPPIPLPPPEKPLPNVASGLPPNVAPPLPPEFMYLRQLATIPALRKKQ